MSVSKGYIPVGQNDEGVKNPSAGEIARNKRVRTGEENIQKEDGGGDGGVESGGGTVFTSADVHTTTYGGGNQKKKRKHLQGPTRVDRFLDNGTPKIFSKELNALTEFLEKSAFPSDNFEAQNRMNNPKRLNWKKKNDDTQHAVAQNELPEGQFYKEDPPAYVERAKNVNDKEKYSSYTLAHQDDMEKKIRGYDKESKKRHGDPDEQPAGQLGGSAGQIDYSGLNKSDGYGMAGQNDDLRRTDDKDRIPRKLNTNTEDGDDEEEQNWWVVEKEDNDTQFLDRFFQKCMTTYEELQAEINDVS
tara:strand:- start:1920 stop:2825 length:906 start_codon:yes stop_codon:yes gene_type:complete